MRHKAQRFDPRQDMQGDKFEIFHYHDIGTRHLDAHYHDFYEVFCFIEGEVDYWVEGSIYHLKPGDILLINPTELHKPVPRNETGNYERIVLWINKAYLSGISPELESCFNPLLPSYKKILRPSALQINEVLRLLMEFVDEFHGNDFAREQASYGLLLQALVMLNRISFGSKTTSSEKYRTSSLISDVISYIGEHYNEELTLDGISKHFFVSKYHLSHEFSKEVGTSIHRYITLKRLNNAHDMLLEGVSPGQVSISCGFGDYTNFFRAFKAEYGISPRSCFDGNS